MAKTKKSRFKKGSWYALNADNSSLVVLRHNKNGSVDVMRVYSTLDQYGDAEGLELGYPFYSVSSHIDKKELFDIADETTDEILKFVASQDLDGAPEGKQKTGFSKAIFAGKRINWKSWAAPAPIKAYDLRFKNKLKERAKIAKLKFPKASQVTAELKMICKDLKDVPVVEGDGIDVRLQVYETGEWAIRTGDAGYDTHHHGFWGASQIFGNCKVRDLREIAADLISQAQDQHAQEYS